MTPRTLLTTYAAYLVLSGVFMWVAGDLSAAEVSEATDGMSRTVVFQRLIGAVMVGSAAPIWTLRGLTGPLMGSLLGAAALLNGVMVLAALVLLEGSGMTTAPVGLLHGVIAVVFLTAWRRERRREQTEDPDPLEVEASVSGPS